MPSSDTLNKKLKRARNKLDHAEREFAKSAARLETARAEYQRCYDATHQAAASKVAAP